ncbi:MAG: diacylglycerol kinase [Xanthomonadaceae bacterium]|jgi:diacylglycerol kinase (ATP)|nr:diacylglycerol kinase [Xanthomonadaceae bacterium]
MADGKNSLLPRGPRGMWKATLWSLRGLGHGFRHESSFRLEVYLFVLLAPLGWWLGTTAVERAVLIGSLLLVLSVELLNSGLEAVVDKASPEFSELAGRAKDLGSAAVFLMLLNVPFCYGLVAWQRFGAGG